MASSAKGLDETIKSLKAKAARLQDLSPALKTFGRWVERNVDDCFDQSVDWDGKPFQPLAPSTIEQRIGNLAAANKRTKSGELTKGARELREKLQAPGGIKPLVDTARARNSQHSDTTADTWIWTAVGYLGYHMAGNERLPVRNPSPFVINSNSRGWKLHPRAQSKLDKIISAYVNRGSTSTEDAA
jgi:hypothetical protein